MLSKISLIDNLEPKDLLEVNLNPAHNNTSIASDYAKTNDMDLDESTPTHSPNKHAVSGVIESKQG